MSTRHGISAVTPLLPEGVREVVDVDEVFKSVIKASSHSIDEEQQWLKHVSWANMDDSLLTLLLPALVNFTELNLMASHGMYFGNMIGRVIRREKPFNIQPAFNSLASFMFTGNGEESGLGLDSLLWWTLKLPAIRAIYGRNTQSNDVPYLERCANVASIPAASSSLVYLDLQNCNVSMAGITKLLRIPRALSTFICELVSTSYFSFTAIRDALKAQEHSLATLWLIIDVDPTVNFYYRYNPSNGTTPMASFVNFKKMKFLKIETICFFGQDVDEEDSHEGDEEDSGQENEGESIENSGWNGSCRRRFTSLFPGTLEVLYLTHCHIHLRRLLLAIEDLLIHKTEHTPALDKIVLEGNFHTQELKLGVGFASLLTQGREQGVFIVFLTDAMPGKDVYITSEEVNHWEWTIDEPRDWME
ncbi:hypothetical protein MMC14_003563 [Varicellaria rhodocarpa]|nr:hypothetical protein [Varicellaria rhodocarpa]